MRATTQGAEDKSPFDFNANDATPSRFLTLSMPKTFARHARLYLSA